MLVYEQHTMQIQFQLNNFLSEGCESFILSLSLLMLGGCQTNTARV